MIKKIDRYICDRCHCSQDFEEDYPVACSPKSSGWELIVICGKNKELCKECYTNFIKLTNDFLENK